MTFKEIFLARVREIESSEDLVNQFCSTSLANQKRVFKILNTNIKTLNTYCPYIDSIVNHPENDNHQKFQVCRYMRIYYDGENEDEKNNVKIRQDLVFKIARAFEGPSSFYKILFLFILGLNSDYNLSDGSEYLFDTLPPQLLDHYDEQVKDILTASSPAMVNPAYGVFVFYPDPDLLDAYLDFYNYEFDDFITTLGEVEDEKINFITTRIKNCQSSALKTESVLFSLYRMISELDLSGKSYDEVVNLICDSTDSKLHDLGYPEFGRLFTFEPGDDEKFRTFLLELEEEEREEIFECLGNSKSLGSVESYVWSGKLAKREPLANDEIGEDTKTTSSGRRGQTKFKRNIIKRVMASEGKCRCAICGCQIEGESFLIASHILPWKYASPTEKIDGNNGLLLCPNHDFLFDGLKVSFDETGKIMISEELTEDNKRAFRLTSETHIKMTPEIEHYMKCHRKAFKKKGWDK